MLRIAKCKSTNGRPAWTQSTTKCGSASWGCNYAIPGFYTDHSRTLIKVLEEKDWLMNENELLKINIAHLARYHTNCIKVDFGSWFFLCRIAQSILKWTISTIIFPYSEHQHQHTSIIATCMYSCYNSIIQQCHVFTSYMCGLAMIWRGKCLHGRYRHHHSCMHHHMCTVLQLRRGSRSPCSHPDTCMRDHRCN